MHDRNDPATLKDRTEGKLFYIIKNGKNQMEREGDRVKAEEDWDMVNYVRIFARKKGAVEEKTRNLLWCLRHGTILSAHFCFSNSSPTSLPLAPDKTGRTFPDRNPDRP
jgi:hypothetical protein